MLNRVIAAVLLAVAFLSAPSLAAQNVAVQLATAATPKLFATETAAQAHCPPQHRTRSTLPRKKPTL